MDHFGRYIKGFINFTLGLVFLVGLLACCNYQIQLVQGSGVQFVPLAVADE